jgi:Acetyltransferase (GNAT) domain
MGALMTRVPYLDLTRGYPRFRKDIRRRLRQSSERIVCQYGVRNARLRTECDPDAIAALHDEIAGAYIARNLITGRVTSLGGLDKLYAQASEVTTLRVDGKLAAWVLATPDAAALKVLAGQLVPGFEDIFPGRLIEAHLIARAMTEPLPRRWWRPWSGRAYAIVSWGSPDHADALIAVS